ncbi:MAG TPA: MFS transporter, partial [Actinomycetales bacterium]|nr:MFS transporter [Actinomycetales bacterium]
MLDAGRARRRYLVLLGLRWLPTGFLVPVLILLMLERGLTLAETGLVSAVTGVTVLLLELPTGGLSDTLGRRPVLLASCAASLAAVALLLVADSLVLFVAAAVLTGVFRALDSGPLESWYVDAALADDADADIETGLARGGVALGVAISVGAVIAGGLVALDPVPSLDALAVPVLAALVLQVVGLVVTALLLVEPRAPSGSFSTRAAVLAVPATIGSGLRLLRAPVLACLVGVEVTWGLGMVTWEQLLPVRLAEVAGDRDVAAALLGPAASAARL